jgi:hypothetical protein
MLRDRRFYLAEIFRLAIDTSLQVPCFAYFANLYKLLKKFKIKI